MVSINIVSPDKKNPQNSTDILSKQILPMYAKYWENDVAKKTNTNFEPHIQALLEMWLGGGLKIFTVKDNDNLIGFIICMVFRPLQYNANVLQIQDLYVEDIDSYEQDVQEYLSNLAGLLNCDEIWYSDNIASNPYYFGDQWCNANGVLYRRLVKRA